jgi:hypothetical protein
MKLPIDTSAIAFLCAMPPEPVVDFETRRPKADESGEPLYVVQLLVMGEDSADLIAVKVPRRALDGHPPGRGRQGGRAGGPALDDGRPLRGVVPGRPDRAGHGCGEGELTGGRWSPSDREGGGRSRRQASHGPLHPPDQVRQHLALASGVSPRCTPIVCPRSAWA